MDKIISNQELEEIKKLKGQVRAAAIKNTFDFLKEHDGPETVEKIDRLMKDLGFPENYRKMRDLSFCDMSLYVTVLLVIERSLHYSQEKFEEMGEFRAKDYLILSLFARKFFSLEKIAIEAPKIWSRYFTTGELKVVNYSKEEKRIGAAIYGYNYYKHHCFILKGFFREIISMLTKEKVSCKEIKCNFEGDDCHEFYLSW